MPLAAPDMRSLAREMFLHALSECSMDKAFERNISCDRGVLRIGEDLYDLRAYGRVYIVSIGKAAHTMVDALTARVGPLEGIVVAPITPEPFQPGFQYFRGGHPLPNAESVKAARAILAGLESQNDASLVIFMISGGGSALCESPIDDAISLQDLIATNKALVLSGAPIAKINAIRKHLSAVKGGRLALAASGAQQVSILVSDVPENALDSLASGPTMADSTTVDDCYAIALEYSLTPHLPASVRNLLERRLLEETPKSDHPAFAHSRWWTILSNATAVNAAVLFAVSHGYAVEIDNSCDDWEYARAADYLLDRLRTLRKGVSRACIISGGEVTVQVKDGGRGGRNQHFALHCAKHIGGEDITVLSAGTDGIDGVSDAAGAVVDGSTVERARAAGHDAQRALEHFDSAPLFEAIGDAIITGPTGTNVRDLRILLAY
jgi:hydroxypyruvate reductase